ncbi:MAG: hypothetical protein R2932_01730 [Caldilineaceae bacterium]
MVALSCKVKEEADKRKGTNGNIQYAFDVAEPLHQYGNGQTSSHRTGMEAAHDIGVILLDFTRTVNRNPVWVSIKIIMNVINSASNTNSANVTHVMAGSWRAKRSINNKHAMMAMVCGATVAKPQRICDPIKP